MKVSDYNKGRKIAELDGDRTYEYGMRKNLRPDTIWADERYLNVTSEEIEEARKKVENKYYDPKD